MIDYTYTARSTTSGETVKAQVTAETEQAAAKLLISRGLFPIEIRTGGQQGLANMKFGTGVSSKDRVVFTRQLATLINAGLPLVQALHSIQSQMKGKTLGTILASVINSVEGGETLSKSFAAFPKVFNQVYVSLVAAGESSGTLDKTLERLADQQEKDAEIVRKIRGAMVYPAIVLAVIIAVMIFMLTAVLPQVGQLYRDLHKTLPILTRLLLATSNFIIKFWWLVLALLGLGGYGLRNYFNTEPGQRLLDRTKLNAPVLGRIFRKVYMARFARTLGTLLGSGVPMIQALGVVKQAISNTLVASSIERSTSEVKGGRALSATLEGDPHFLALVPQMIKIGEQSGGIDDMLNKVATFYENEVDDEIKTLSTTIEPVLMVVLGLTVGLVIAAILLPVYGLVGSGGLSSLK